MFFVLLSNCKSFFVYSVYQFFIRYVICKSIFLLVYSLSFHFLNDFFETKKFEFWWSPTFFFLSIMLFVVYLGSPCLIQIPPVFFWMFYILDFMFRFLILLNFYALCEIWVQLFACGYTISQHCLLKNYSFSIEFPCYHCQKSIDCKYKDLFLSVHLHLYICPYANDCYWLWLSWNFDCLKKIGVIGHKTLTWTFFFF